MKVKKEDREIYYFPTGNNISAKIFEKMWL